MRFLEMVLLVLGILLPFLISSKKVDFSNKLLLLPLVGTLLLHALLEGVRWQVSPIYVVHLLLIICLLKGYVYFKGNWFRKMGSGIFLFLLIGIGYALSTILPVFDLPTPTGNYKVGAQYLHFISEEEEDLTEEIGDKRELMIKVWYPANIKNEEKEIYLNEGERKGLAAKYGLPPSLLNYLDKVKTNTFIKPAITSGEFPVLIFSPGYYSNATGYYALLEEITSQGFIVLNINHTYESVGALFPSGQTKLYALDYDRAHNNAAMAKMVWEAMENFKKANTLEEKTKAIEHTLKNYFAAEITNRWANDINEIAYQLPKWNQSTFLAEHIDFSKIGVFGHSQGGAAAGQALLENSKISAGINIDGAQWGDQIDTFYSNPFLLLASDWPAEHPDFNEVAYQNGSTADFYTAKIKQTGHSSFMDIPFMLRLSVLNEAGSIEPAQAITISANLVTAFFNTYLNEESIDLLGLPQEYPALEMKKQKRRL